MILIEYLIKEKLIFTYSEVKRLIHQGGIKVNNEPVKDLNKVVYCGDYIRVGKYKETIVND